MNQQEDKTKVLCIDMDPDSISYLKDEGLDVYEGTFGPIIRRKYNNDIVPIRLEHDLPNNLQEYNVIIEDMLHTSEKEYDEDFHSSEKLIESKNDESLYLCPPQNVFDPVPLMCHVLRLELTKYKNDLPRIIITFQNKKYKEEYTTNRDNGEYNNYDYMPCLASAILSGEKTELANNKMSETLFKDLTCKLSYLQTYQQLNNDNFKPLLYNGQKEIISYMFCNNNVLYVMLPRTDNKKELLQRLFERILYKNFSDVFPYQTKNSWLEKSEYKLPEIISLETEKEKLTQGYNKAITEKDTQIEQIKTQKKWLYGMLTDSGSELVNDVITFMNWLGYENVINVDDTKDKEENNEEDIRIELGNKDILVAEVKGIYGTSKDSECSQISKIKIRRLDEQVYNKVYALYIVNNERGKEPLKRTIPPFNSTQITDAKNTHRAMAYTWQLFNLYFEIKSGVITKEESKSFFLTNGLVDTRSMLYELGKPYNFYKDNSVACIEVHETEIKVGDYFYYEDKNFRLHRVKIISIQCDHQKVPSAKNGKFGFGLENEIPNVSMLYLHKSCKL